MKGQIIKNYYNFFMEQTMQKTSGKKTITNIILVLIFTGILMLTRQVSAHGPNSPPQENLQFNNESTFWHHCI